MSDRVRANLKGFALGFREGYRYALEGMYSPEEVPKSVGDEGWTHYKKMKALSRKLDEKEEEP